jgi:hypothetical protein
MATKPLQGTRTVAMFDRFIFVDWSANSSPKTGKDSIWMRRCPADLARHEDDNGTLVGRFARPQLLREGEVDQAREEGWILWA